MSLIADKGTTIENGSSKKLLGVLMKTMRKSKSKNTCFGVSLKRHNKEKLRTLMNYFLLGFAQMKITLFIYFNNWENNGKRKFLAIAEPCSSSRTVFSCNILLAKKNKIFLCKYIYICPIYTVLIQLILVFLCDLRWAHAGSNSSEKSVSDSNQEPQAAWPLCSEVGILRVVPTYAEP